MHMRDRVNQIFSRNLRVISNTGSVADCLRRCYETSYFQNLSSGVHFQYDLQLQKLFLSFYLTNI